MKLLDFYTKEDYGTDYIFTLLKGKRRSFLQVSGSWNDYGGGPYLQIAFGNNRLMDVLLWVWKLGFSFELLGITWGSWEK